MRLVTLAEAKDQLSILDSEDDARINRLVLDASAIVMNYLKRSPALLGWTDSDGVPLLDDDGNPQTAGGEYELDDNGEPVLDDDGNPVLAVNGQAQPVDAGVSVVPGAVRAATLLIIATLDDDREGKRDPITPAVESLLMRYRDPAIA